MTPALSVLLKAIQDKKVKTFKAYNRHYEKVTAYSHNGLLWFLGNQFTDGEVSGRDYVFTNTLYRDNEHNRRLFNVLSGIERVRVKAEKEFHEVRSNLQKVKQ